MHPTSSEPATGMTPPSASVRGRIVRRGRGTPIVARWAAVLALIASSFASANTVNFSVTNANDSGPGSLRQALLDLQTNPDEVLFVTFQPGYPQGAAIQLQSPLPLLNQRGVIISGGDRNPRIVASPAGTAGILHAAAPLQGLTLSGLHFEGGRNTESGGCVRGVHNNIFQAPAALTIDNSSFTDCQVIAESTAAVTGGAVHWRSPVGSVTIYGSDFRNNRVSNGAAGSAFGSGGAVSLGGTLLVVEGSQFFNNRVEAVGASAGAIYSGLNVTGLRIQDSVFVGNRVLSETDYAVGGAVSAPCFEDCELDFDRNYFDDNRSSEGGALFVQRGTVGPNAQLRLATNTFFNNQASSRGGALALFSTDLDLTFNTFEANAAVTGGAHLRTFSSRIRRVDHNAFGSATGEHCQFINTDTSQRNSSHNALIDAGCRQRLDPDAAAITSTGSFALDLSEPMPVIAYAVGGPIVDAGGDCLALDARGTLRPQDGNGDGIARCDIGAYERPSPTVFRNGFEP